MIELHREKELEETREKMEAMAAGVREINDRQVFLDTCVNDVSETLLVIFWGGPWCRKCNALKPEVSYVCVRVSAQRLHASVCLSRRPCEHLLLGCASS